MSELKLPGDWTYDSGMMMSNCMCCGRESRQASAVETLVFDALIAVGVREIESSEDLMGAFASVLATTGKMLENATAEIFRLQDKTKLLTNQLEQTQKRLDNLTSSTMPVPGEETPASLLEVVTAETARTAGRTIVRTG
jgi:hypothetical protein